MFAVRTSGPRPFILWLFSFLMVFSLALAAQDSDREKKKEKEEESKKRAKAGLVDIKGSVRCQKANPSHAIEVPDRPGHALIIAKRQCTWSEPLVILGGKTKTGVFVAFFEQMEGQLHPHGYEVDTMDDGETIAMQTMGYEQAEKPPTVVKGRFSFTRGTGKYKGLKGGGSYEGQLEADDVMTITLEGVYEPAAMAGGKK